MAEDERLRKLETIKRAATGMDFLIRDLLDVARIESGAFPIERAPVDMRTLLHEVLELFEQQARSRQITLVCDAVPDIGVVLADHDRLRQALSNLLDNAVNFTPDHGRVALRAHRLAKEVEISVEDTGPGIPAENLPHIFDRFWRADRDWGSWSRACDYSESRQTSSPSIPASQTSTRNNSGTGIISVGYRVNSKRGVR